MSVRVGKWSKALILGRSFFGELGSNTTTARITFFTLIMIKKYRDWNWGVHFEHKAKHRIKAPISLGRDGRKIRPGNKNRNNSNISQYRHLHPPEGYQAM